MVSTWEGGREERNVNASVTSDRLSLTVSHVALAFRAVPIDSMILSTMLFYSAPLLSLFALLVFDFIFFFNYFSFVYVCVQCLQTRKGC